MGMIRFGCWWLLFVVNWHFNCWMDGIAVITADFFIHQFIRKVFWCFNCCIRTADVKDLRIRDWWIAWVKFRKCSWRVDVLWYCCWFIDGFGCNNWTLRNHYSIGMLANGYFQVDLVDNRADMILGVLNSNIWFAVLSIHATADLFSWLADLVYGDTVNGIYTAGWITCSVGVYSRTVDISGVL